MVKSEPSWKSEQRTYQTWANMRRRCKNTNNMHYGARGISVCKRWETFDKFFEDMGKRPIGNSIDRIDNDGNYTPDNCRWSTQREQLQNRRTTKRLNIKGKILSVAEASVMSGIKRETILMRIRRGCTGEQAIRVRSRDKYGKK